MLLRLALLRAPVTYIVTGRETSNLSVPLRTHRKQHAWAARHVYVLYVIPVCQLCLSVGPDLVWGSRSYTWSVSSRSFDSSVKLARLKSMHPCTTVAVTDESVIFQLANAASTVPSRCALCVNGVWTKNMNDSGCSALSSAPVFNLRDAVFFVNRNKNLKKTQ